MPLPDPAISVFVNCPFDEAYDPLLRAIIFATVSCGFVPRSALESGSVANPRLDRILEAVFGSHFSIHDLTRCQGEGADGLARFNMPLELGMAIARRYRNEADHDWLVLVPEGHNYQKFISDLGGIDPKRHDGTTAMLVRRVMAWLATKSASPLPNDLPPKVLQRLPSFDAIWLQSFANWQEVRWWEMVEQAQMLAKGA
jgi:hypothetical protein